MMISERDETAIQYLQLFAICDLEFASVFRFSASDASAVTKSSSSMEHNRRIFAVSSSLLYELSSTATS